MRLVGYLYEYLGNVSRKGSLLQVITTLAVWTHFLVAGRMCKIFNPRTEEEAIKFKMYWKKLRLFGNILRPKEDSKHEYLLRYIFREHIWTWEAEGYKFYFIISEKMHNFCWNFLLFQMQVVVSPNTVPG